MRQPSVSVSLSFFFFFFSDSLFFCVCHKSHCHRLLLSFIRSHTKENSQWKKKKQLFLYLSLLLWKRFMNRVWCRNICPHEIMRVEVPGNETVGSGLQRFFFPQTSLPISSQHHPLLFFFFSSLSSLPPHVVIPFFFFFAAAVPFLFDLVFSAGELHASPCCASLESSCFFFLLLFCCSSL